MSELELAACLSRVEAPEELWLRIQSPARPQHRTTSPLLAAAAVFLVTMASGAWYVARNIPAPAAKPVVSHSSACATCHLS